MGLHWMQGLAYCKTLARETQGCAGPELIQWQELLRARVRLGLPQEYEAWCRCRRASLRLSRRDLRSALPAACSALLPQESATGRRADQLALSGRVAAASMRWLARATLALLAVVSADDCHDRNIDCSDWAEEGECDSDEMRDWMAEHCPVSCRKCKARPRAPSRAPTRGGEL